VRPDRQASWSYKVEYKQPSRVTLSVCTVLFSLVQTHLISSNPNSFICTVLLFSSAQTLITPENHTSELICTTWDNTMKIGVIIISNNSITNSDFITCLCCLKSGHILHQVTGYGFILLSAESNHVINSCPHSSFSFCFLHLNLFSCSSTLIWIMCFLVI
jgi:hypothetical protein